MSQKPIAERLQVKGDRRLAVIGATPALEQAIGALDRRAARFAAAVTLLFVADQASLRAALEGERQAPGAAAILWVAYPKLTSSLAGDLSRDLIRAMAQEHGFQTVSQIAIDADWSALRLKRVA